MASPLFYKLSIEKQENIKQAAIKEFSEHQLIKASINRIIKDINMPRGTFYLYFNNIEELYLELLKDVIEKITLEFIFILKKNKGDLLITYKEIFDYIYQSNAPNKEFIKNGIKNINGQMMNDSIKKEKLEVRHQILGLIDMNKLNLKEKDLKDLVSILNIITFHHLVLIFEKGVDYELVRNKYINKLNLVMKGIYIC